MKKIFIFSATCLFILSAIQVSAQTSQKQKSDTTKTCKPTKSGKHCSKPSNG
jgi:hypothetical protein